MITLVVPGWRSDKEAFTSAPMPGAPKGDGRTEWSGPAWRRCYGIALHPARAYDAGGSGVVVPGPDADHFFSINARISRRGLPSARSRFTSSVMPVQTSQPKLIGSSTSVPSGRTSRI